MQDIKPLIEVENLTKHFSIGKNKTLQAVDNISFTIYKGETLGLVGESGCGKSTVGRTLIQLYTPTSGKVKYAGEELGGTRGETSKRSIAKNIQMIYQDPYSSLNPRMTVLEIISEGLVIHYPNMSQKERRNRVLELLELVGLNQLI